MYGRSKAVFSLTLVLSRCTAGRASRGLTKAFYDSVLILSAQIGSVYVQKGFIAYRPGEKFHSPQPLGTGVRSPEKFGGL